MLDRGKKISIDVRKAELDRWTTEGGKRGEACGKICSWEIPILNEIDLFEGSGKMGK